MKNQNKRLFITFCFITLVTACSNEPKIKSATEDMVVVNAPAESFLDAYDLAKKECEKNTRITKYQPDDTVGLETLIFNCINQEGETVADATTETDTEKSVIEEEDEESTMEIETLEEEIHTE